MIRLASGTYHNWPWEVTTDRIPTERTLWIRYADSWHYRGTVPADVPVDNLPAWVENWLNANGYGR